MEKKDIDIELKLLVAPIESDLPMAEQMKNKKDYEKQVDSLCVQSDELIRDMNFEYALLKLIEAYKIVTDHPWSIKQKQIYELIQNAQFKRQESVRKEHFSLQQQKERERDEKKQQALIQSHQQEVEKQKQAKEERLKQIQELKQKEDEISDQAFKILEEGQTLLKSQQYDELITKYTAAKNLFLQIKWNGEAQKVEDSIQEFAKKKQILIQKQEKERTLREEQDSEWRTKEQQLTQQHDQQEQLESEEKKKLEQSHSRKDLENEVYKKLDEATGHEKSGELSNAIQSYEQARSIMERLGWNQQIPKLNDSIKTLVMKLKQETERKTHEHLLEQRKHVEEEDLQRRIKEQQEERQKQESAREKKLRLLQEKKEVEQRTSEKAFQQIEEIEKEVKFYKEHAKIDEFAIDCPYLQAKGVYQNSRELLLSISWKKEADKLLSAISMYEKLYHEDQKERVLYNQRREKELVEEQNFEESIRLQKEEKEREERTKIRILQARDKQKTQISEIRDQAFQQIEEIEKEVKFYMENAITKNYALNCPYLEARNVYQSSRELLLKIEWKEEADKLLSTISMYENLHLKDQKERASLMLKNKRGEIEEQKIEETIRLQKEEQEKKEHERLQKLQEQGKKKEYIAEISKFAFAQIEEIEKVVKYYNEHALAENFSLSCPYLRAKEVYQSSRETLLSIGWKEEADKLLPSISTYENLYKKDQIDRQKVEFLKKKQEEEERLLEESIQLQKDEKERQEKERLEKLQELSKKKEEEEEISKAAFVKIEEIEKEVKYYNEHVVAENYSLHCPFLQAKDVYKSSREQLLSIGWKKEADKLSGSISMYEKLAQKDEKEREKYLKNLKKLEEEQKKLEESIRLQNEEQEKKERERLRVLREQDQKKKQDSEISNEALSIIDEIEKEVAFYKERVKVENYNLECPYQRAKEVYHQAREILLGIGWSKEADKLSHSISLYSKLEKEDFEIRNKFKKRLEQEKKEEEELQETIRKERERLNKEEEQRNSEKAQRDLKRKEEEELQQVAYNELEEGNISIQEKDFEKATERLNEALQIFKKIKWKNGVKLTEDAIKYKDKEHEKFEKLLSHERLALHEKTRKEREFQKFIDEQRRRKEQEEQNRKLELLRMDMEGKKIGEKQESALKKLEEGNELVNIREYKKANSLYEEALNIFQEIGWIDGVEKTKGAISHNMLEQERYNQQLELQKRQEKEKEKEEQELRELIKKRQELTQLEEEQKQLKLAQKHGQAEKIKKQQQEALKLLEQGNVKITEHNFDEANKLFLQAMGIFKEIKWDHGIKITNEIMNHNSEERQRFEQLKERDERARLEQIKQQKELEKMLIDQKLMTEQESQLKQLKQQQESDKISKIQSLEDEAMKFLEQGNQEITNQNFDQARTLFTVAMKIFQKMGWKKGIDMVNDALNYNERELVNFNNERMREEQKKKEAALRREEINQLIQESKEEEVKKQLEWKQKLEEKTRRLDEENQVKDQIFSLLEKGSTLASKNEFLSAIDHYKKTIPLFEKISWTLKRDQVIDLIDTTQQDYNNYRTHLAKEEAVRLKQIQEEEELNQLVETEQLKEKERLRATQRKQMEQMEQDKKKEELRQQAADEINKAAVMLERRKFDTALDSLHIALTNFKELGWTKEAQTTEDQIAEVQKQKRETYKPIDREKISSDMEISEKGYNQIDEADKLIRQKQYQEALPFLEEAKRLFEKIQWQKAMKMVEIRIRETENMITQKEELIEKLRARQSRKTEKEAYRLLEKVDKFRREGHFDYALTSAKEAHRIFTDLDWKREANELLPLIEDIMKEINEQKQTREQLGQIRAEKIKIEEDEDKKIQDIIEERRRRRKETRDKLKEY